jgi:hypothetical protein
LIRLDYRERMKPVVMLSADVPAENMHAGGAPRTGFVPSRAGSRIGA